MFQVSIMLERHIDSFCALCFILFLRISKYPGLEAAKHPQNTILRAVLLGVFIFVCELHSIFFMHTIFFRNFRNLIEFIFKGACIKF